MKRERNGVVKAREEMLKHKTEKDKLAIVEEKEEIEQLEEKEEVDSEGNDVLKEDNEKKENNDDCKEQENEYEYECELNKKDNNKQDNDKKELCDYFDKENIEDEIRDEKQEIIENNNNKEDDIQNIFQFNEHFEEKEEPSLPKPNTNENIFEIDNNNTNNQNEIPKNKSINTLNFNFESFETKTVSDNINNNNINNNNDLFTFTSPTVSQSPFNQNESSQAPIFDFDFVNKCHSQSVKILQPSTDFFSFPQTPSQQSKTNLSQSVALFDFSLSPSPSLNFPLITPEDSFDPAFIHKKIRCSIMEKGVLINTKGSFENITFRGHIDLELSSFHVNNKTLFLSVQHPKWNDNNFFKKANYNNLITNESKSEYELLIKNISSNQRILEYTPNLKIIEPAVNFDVKGSFENEEYVLRIVYQLTKEKLKKSSLIITIITKSNEINISDSTDHSYVLGEKKIVYKFDNFAETQKNQIGLKFHTKDECFVENVRVTYRYMDSVPSNLNACLKYKDEQNEFQELNVVKKCMVEIKFTP